tara:strand:- start:679 stop:903 length:225 start_codon:yes stop_codon:yes gene_type:complete
LYQQKEIEIMTTQEIKVELLKGKQTQYSNENADWYTVNRPNENTRIIFFGGEPKFYKSINSYAKRISQLINKGY